MTTKTPHDAALQLAVHLINDMLAVPGVVTLVRHVGALPDSRFVEYAKSVEDYQKAAASAPPSLPALPEVEEGLQELMKLGVLRLELSSVGWVMRVVQTGELWAKA